MFQYLQALPCNLDHIEATPILKEDHTRGVLVNRFDIMYEAFDNKVASGPVPIFFSAKPKDTLEDLKKSPEWAFHCLQALVSRLLVRSQLTR